MSAIGVGQYVRVQMWNGAEVIHDGILPPGDSCALWFTAGAQPVTKFALTRMTKAEVDELPPTEGDGWVDAA